MNVLPIDAAIPTLRRVLIERHEVVLQAPPGAGKTTRVPLALLNEAWLQEQSILLLQPRRVAARAAAGRMASELGEKVRETVGYRIRLESRVGALLLQLRYRCKSALIYWLAPNPTCQL